MKTQRLFAFRFISALLLLAVVTTCSNKLSAQDISTHQYRYVAPDKVDEFIKRETTYWSKVAKKAIDNGKLTFWGLFEKVGGSDLQNEPNFLFINTYTNIDSAGSVWNPAAVFPKIPMAQIEDFSFSKNTCDLFLMDKGWEQASNVVEEKDFRYVAIYYHSSSNPDSFIAAEKKIWGPFIKASMDKNLTTQRGWGNAIVLAPLGPSMKFNSVSYDLFPSLKDALLQKWDPSAQFPMEGLTELDKLRTGPPSREIYRVVKVVNKEMTK
jgi:hypothetical protein